MAALLLGRDTVTLRFRDPVLDDAEQPTFDADGRPAYADRLVVKTGAKFTIDEVTTIRSETDSDAVVVYRGRAALVPDVDSRALLAKDAIEHDGKVYELAGDALVKRTLIGGVEHHVRVRFSREERVAASKGELVSFAVRGGQDDDGRRLPDGDPFDVLALAVDPGNTAERYGARGTVTEADFTIVVPLGVLDDAADYWVTVRGVRCTARVQRQFSEHPDQNRDVVLARSRTGG